VTAVDFDDDNMPVCGRCGEELEFVDCWDCGGELYTHHDCGEDTCCCLEPVDNVPCQICEGKGGFLVCPIERCRATPQPTEAA
jgi:hypothetical protein